MFIDARQIDDGSLVQSEICIIGAGAAGIALARRLAISGRQICLLESGGLEFDADTQSLNSARNVGRQYHDVGTSRLRYFGGTTNHWAGFCAAMQPTDFEVRSGVPNSGWPISLEDLKPFYTPAQAVCELDQVQLDERETWPVAPSPALAALDETLLSTVLFQRSPPTRFGTRYRTDIEKTEDIRCFLWANVIEIIPDEAGRITTAAVATLSGKRFFVSAAVYVLACGAIENARVLLNSRSKTPRGLGNDADLVGRFFMEHPGYPNALRIVPTALGSTLPLVAGDDERNFRSLALSQHRLRQRGGIAMGFEGEEFEPAVSRATVQTVLESLRRGQAPSDLPHHLLTLMEQRREGMRAVLEALPGGERVAKRIPHPPRPLMVHVIAEQTPIWQSRVMLTDERDALGQQRIVLDWRIRPEDVADVRRGIEELGAELRRTNLAAAQLLLEPESEHSIQVVGHWHHMGTTRMSDDPKTGVVDRNCRVHGIRNLYVAGGSVFATSGWVNPTLTIVALALRLADHIESEVL
ncbi:GMC family oxidoreductase [Hyphomicrobium sp. CS1GBMeth3]|uniref:GMC oxidoreductase n=1 Tax=Hyphomicrobium sp. CS1GBMeth3 TaxID=1892845 RepID=UPI0009314138|nr:GMC family oxidoreductase [Hyphomicrobium sp. CS1GBMeth3]